MPVLNGAIHATDGALVDVLVGPSRLEVRRLRNAGRPVPAPVQLRAVLDTGAECTCVDVRALATLALPLRGVTLVNAPALGGLTGAVRYDAGLAVVHPSGNPQNHWVISDWMVADLSLGALGHQALIGRDLLNHAAFLYEGRAGTFTLTY